MELEKKKRRIKERGKSTPTGIDAEQVYASEVEGLRPTKKHALTTGTAKTAKSKAVVQEPIKGTSTRRTRSQKVAGSSAH